MQDSDSLTPTQRAEILLNRTNVALARSQRLIESWLPPKPEAVSTSAQTDNHDDDEDFFKSMSETAGIGSAKAFDAEDDGVLRRKGGLTKGNEKLLETILGKKGARERVRSLGKGTGESGGHVAAKKMEVKAVRRGVAREVEDDDDDDEEERAARFGGKKRRRVGAEDDDQLEKGGEEEADTRQKVKEARVERRKPVSYLDELLAGKKSKKNKKNHTHGDATGA